MCFLIIKIGYITIFNITFDLIIGQFTLQVKYINRAVVSIILQVAMLLIRDDVHFGDEHDVNDIILTNSVGYIIILPILPTEQ